MIGQCLDIDQSQYSVRYLSSLLHKYRSQKFLVSYKVCQSGFLLCSAGRRERREHGGTMAGSDTNLLSCVRTQPRAAPVCLVREDFQNHISMLIPEQSVTRPYFTGL